MIMQWNPISSIPKDGTVILIKTFYGVLICYYDTDIEDWISDDMLPIDDTNEIEGWLPYDGEQTCH